MNSFERIVLQKFRKIIAMNELRAVAYRLKQSRFCSQVCDLLVDSGKEELYLAIECKSRKNKMSLNFQSDFSKSKEGGQLEVLTQFCHNSGRKGIIIFKAYKEIKVASLIEVLSLKEQGKKSINMKDKDLWEDIEAYLHRISK